MAKLNLTYRSTLCRQFTSSSPVAVPTILYASTYYNTNRGGTFLTIFGTNFRDYSIVKIANIIHLLPTIYFNSETIAVYISNNYPLGDYNVQVFNDRYSSNIVTFTLS